MAQGQLLGHGRCAEIIALDDDRALKLYEPRFSLEFIETWAAAASSVADAGVPAPKVYSVEMHGDRVGVVMERIAGGNLFEAMLANPDDTFGYGEQLADLLVAIHNAEVDGLRDRRVEMLRRVESIEFVDESIKQRVGEILTALDGTSDGVVHGDLHPGNVMCTPDGQLVAIDWDGAMRGALGHDIVRTEHLLGSWALTPDAPQPDRIAELRPALVAGFLARCQTAPLVDAGADQWRLPVIVARLFEPIEEERSLVLSQVEAEWQRLNS